MSNQIDSSSGRLLLPVHFTFLWLSILAAVLLSFIPSNGWPLPDFIVLVLIFWAIREPQHISLGTAFFLGLIADIAYNGLFGQHSIAYVLTVFLCNSLSRKILWFHFAPQSVFVFFLLVFSLLLRSLTYVAMGGSFPPSSYFLSCLVGALMWPPLNFFLLIPQQRTQRGRNQL